MMFCSLLHVGLASRFWRLWEVDNFKGVFFYFGYNRFQASLSGFETALSCATVLKAHVVLEAALVAKLRAACLLLNLTGLDECSLSSSNDSVTFLFYLCPRRT